MFNTKSALPGLLLLVVNAMFGMLLATPVRAATTYYVATNGSDNNPGTQDQPFATLAQAAKKVADGDTVIVRGGTYYLNSPVWIENSGTASAHIVFQSYTGEKVILDGSNSPANKDLVVITGQYIDFKNFEMRQSHHIGVSIWGGMHVRIQNNIIHDTSIDGIYVGSTDTDVLVNGNTVYNTNLLYSSSHGTGGWGSAINANGNGRIRVTANNVYNNYGEGIAFRGSGALISGNTVHDNFSVEIYLNNATNSTVQKNLIYTTNNSNFYRNGQPSAGIQLANEDNSNLLNNNKILNNVVLGGAEGLAYFSNYGFGGGLKNTVIANNTFYTATGTMLVIEQDAGHTNTVIANNIFYQTGSGAMSEVAANSGLSFQNNCWYGGSAGSAAGSGDMSADPLLVNPGSTLASDYKLQPGSPAIHAGSTVSQVSDDFFGTPRPQGQYDIGAYQNP